MGAPEFWDDPDAAARTSSDHSRSNARLDGYNALNADLDELDGMIELAREEEGGGALEDDFLGELTEQSDIELPDKDLRVDTYRASGAGGQHVNKTDSAVRITHLATGIVVQCQNERSQTQNRATAMALLRSRLRLLEIEEREAEAARERGETMKIGFGSQIRSYVIHPYTMVKDLRTDHEVGNAQGVLDGDIDGFIRAELERRAKGKA